jgi:sulfate adenylyltransferase
VSWHPPRAVLELFELVLDGALPGLPQALDLLAAADLAGVVARVEPGAAGSFDGAADGACPDAAGGELTVEDAEGTPVARLTADGRLTPLRPFSHPPLRSHRRPPGQVASARPLVGVLTGVPTAAGVSGLIDEAGAAGRELVWLVVVGTGRRALNPHAAWRAATGLVAAAEDAGVVARAVPVAVPVLPGSGDVLVAPVAAAYAGGPAGVRLPADAGPAGEGAPSPYRAELARAALPPDRRGVTVFFTGLSGSGKSTVARRLAARLVERGERTVTLLDGDEVRRMLSHGLGFSRADRDLNIRRIGFVAAEVARHGGLAICAPIAPFAQVRAQVRVDVEEAGGDLVLVHVATPLAECERRDRKGLYARARRGEIPDFTGISSPYEPPTDADLILDTTGRDVEACVEEVQRLLAQRGYLAPAASGGSH